MKVENILTDEFRMNADNEVLITESGAFPMSPFIAFAALKRKIFNRLKKTKGFVIAKEVAETPTKMKAKAMTAAEKARAAVGITSGKGKGATVYKLTPEQMKVMSDVYTKYGKKLTGEILKFRKNILAPYQLIKRAIKKSARVTSKDIAGMSREEYQSALESGRKKIEARGEEFFGKARGSRRRLDDIDERIKALDQIRKNFLAGKKPEYNIANKVYKSFGAGEEEFEGYSREELRKVYDSLMSARREMRDELARLKSKKGLTPEDFAKAQELMHKVKQLESGQAVDLTKDEQFKHKGRFNVALGRYFFSREIWKDLTSPGKFDVFKKTYLSIIEKMINRARERKKNEFNKFVKMKKTIELTDKESMIWARRPTVKTFSGDIKDYYLKVTPEQFLEKPIRVKRSPRLRRAEQEIENEIKRFERKLGKIVTAEDLGRLKRYRLINNLISVRELETPENLFKTKEEIKKETKAASQEGEYLSPDEFVRRIRDIATIEFDTMAELRNAKIQATTLARQMKEQGNSELVEKYSNILRQIKLRRDTAPQKIIGQESEPTGIIDIDDIQNLANKMLKREYEDPEEIKHDKRRLETMISKYKESDPEAERNLEEIDFLLKRLTRKLERGA